MLADLTVQGAPYKYGVRQLSKSFEEAPAVILKAIKRLTWAGEHALTGEFESFKQFNECLSIGYFENTKIGVSTVKTMLQETLADFI
jgi:hypothetical protein